MVVVIEVPVVWEIPPRGGSVLVVSGVVCFVGLVGLGLVFQDLGVTTLQGRLVTRLSEALERSLGMTLSRVDLVFVWYRERCLAT